MLRMIGNLRGFYVKFSLLNKKVVRSETRKESSSKMVEDVKFTQKNLQKIDQINKYFMGIRMNTKYAQFYNQDTITNIDKFSGRKIGDLPYKIKAIKIQQQVELQNNPLSNLTQNILSKINTTLLNAKIIQLSDAFFKDLVNKTRNAKIQPNFQREARRVFSSLKKDNYTIQLNENVEIKPSISFIEAQLIKGLQVTRNNNFSVDSYEVINENQYIHYKLWEKGTYKIPQEEWFTKKNMILRIKAKIVNSVSINISNSNQKIKCDYFPHTFVFEMDLKKPPRFAEFRLTQRQYFKKYEPILDNLTITNVDGRNPFAAFTFEENEKKSVLINKLI